MQQGGSSHNLPMVNVNAPARNNVLNRVTTTQDKWKRQVCPSKIRLFSLLCFNLLSHYRYKSKGKEFMTDIQC